MISRNKEEKHSRKNFEMFFLMTIGCFLYLDESGYSWNYVAVIAAVELQIHVQSAIQLFHAS